MKKITKSDLLEHFENDDFLEVYGEPVFVEDETGGTLVFMSKDLYEKLVMPLEGEF